MELHERIARVCQVLGVSADYLLLGRDTEHAVGAGPGGEAGDLSLMRAAAAGEFVHGRRYMRTVGPKGTKYALVLRQLRLVIKARHNGVAASGSAQRSNRSASAARRCTPSEPGVWRMCWPGR